MFQYCCVTIIKYFDDKIWGVTILVNVQTLSKIAHECILAMHCYSLVLLMILIKNRKSSLNIYDHCKLLFCFLPLTV